MQTNIELKHKTVFFTTKKAQIQQRVYLFSKEGFQLLIIPSCCIYTNKKKR